MQLIADFALRCGRKAGNDVSTLVGDCYCRSVLQYLLTVHLAPAGVFAAARAAAPSVVFLDEVDAVAPARPHAAASGAGGGGAGGPAADAAARLVATLLSEMDGGGAGVYLVQLVSVEQGMRTLFPACGPPAAVAEAGGHFRNLDAGLCAHVFRRYQNPPTCLSS